MAITDKTIKILWSNAAGRCSFPCCNLRLTSSHLSNSAPHILGEMAHIKGKRKGSNRYDMTQKNLERDNYENLILLCPTHHTMIDKPENEKKYSVSDLLGYKKNHENSISVQLKAELISSVMDLKSKISEYLADNRQAWVQYGPFSDIAKKNPNSEELHAVWLSERLSTIVPNNRAIVELLKINRKLFEISSQDTVSRFLNHANSYEKWVNDETTYQAVLRFPIDFEHLIKGN